jgi:predicted permease
MSFSEWMRRLRGLGRGSALERDLDDEIQFHLAMRADSNRTAGMTDRQASQAAQKQFGNIELRKENLRGVWRFEMVENSWREARYAVRTLGRSPGFTLAALLALGLGIGVNTAVFSVVNSVLLRPLPFPESERLVMIFNSRPLLGIKSSGASMADYLDWRARSRSFQSLDIFNINRFTLTGGGEAEQIVGMSVTSTAFEALKVQPLFGRTFMAGEDEPGRPLAVVLSERFWHRRFASSRDVLGKEMTINGRPHTVIGVMPAGVEFGPRDVDAWATLTVIPPTRRGPFIYRGLARLKPGVSAEQAAAEMQSIARGVEREHPAGHAQLAYPVTPLNEVIVGRIRQFLWILSGAVLLVLLIAVSNVANLMLARAASRQRETAIRLSIGAGRGQLIRQFMTESILLSLGGGAIGYGLAIWGVATLRWLGPRDLPRLNEITVDGRVLAFTLLASLASALLFGLAPAFSASASALNESLKQGGRGGESRGQGRLRNGLVVAQVMLSVFLLIGAGLLIRSFALLGQVSPGFNAPPSAVLTMNVAPVGPRYKDRAALTVFWDQVLERVQSIPGVEAVSVAITLPPDRLDLTDDYEVESKPLPPGSQHQAVPVQYVSSDYFKTLEVPLLRGRTFNGQDREGTTPVTVISETMARRHFAGENPIGQRLKYGGKPLEIVGVVGDVQYQGLEREHVPVFYQAMAQTAQRRVWLVVRTRGVAHSLVPAVRQALHGLDPDVPVDRVGSMAETLTASLSLPRFRSLLMAVFAVTALLLAGIGIYGVIAYSVAQRRQEIGVRMALGATRANVLTLIIGQGSRLTLLGIAAGLAGAFVLATFLRTMLFGITPSDTVTFAGVALILGAVAIVASLIPALRASRIDPVTALRQD